MFLVSSHRAFLSRTLADTITEGRITLSVSKVLNDYGKAKRHALLAQVILIQAAEAVGEDFVDDGDGEEEGERDGEHEEDRYERDEEEHGVCRAEGLHPLDQHGRPPLTLPNGRAGARKCSMTSRIAG